MEFVLCSQISFPRLASDETAETMSTINHMLCVVKEVLTSLPSRLCVHCEHQCVLKLVHNSHYDKNLGSLAYSGACEVDWYRCWSFWYLFD